MFYAALFTLYMLVINWLLKVVGMIDVRLQKECFVSFSSENRSSYTDSSGCSLQSDKTPINALNKSSNQPN